MGDRRSVPTNFVDLHAHVLPQVDDGPRDLRTSVELLRVAHETGTRTIVATPHMFLFPFGNEDPADLWRAYLALLASLDRLKNDPDTAFLKYVNVYLGAEHFFGSAFLEALETDKVLPLKDTRHLLIEFSPLFSTDEIVYGVKKVLAARYVPVLAHAERYRGLQRAPIRVRELRELGCIIQVNGDSLLGWLPSPIGRAAWAMVKEGLVDIVASDAHGVDQRGPRLKRVAQVLSRRVSEEAAVSLLQTKPAQIIGLAE